MFNPYDDLMESGLLVGTGLVSPFADLEDDRDIGFVIRAFDILAITTPKPQPSLFTGPNDFHGDSFATATVADLGSGFSGQINAVDDIDVFRIDLDPGEFSVLRVYSAPSTVSAQIYDDEFNLLATLDPEHTYWVDGFDSGSFYMRVTGGDQDSYEADFGFAPEDESDWIDTNGRLRAGDSLQGFSHGLSDSDWFLLIGSQGETLRFIVENTGSSTAPDVQIIGADGPTLATGQDLGDGRTEISFTLPDNDSYFLAVQPGTELGSTYQISTPVDGDDYPDNATTTGMIGLGGTLSGTINRSGDFDWIGFSAEAGETLVFRLTPEVGDVQPIVSVVDELGVYVADALITYGPGNSYFDLIVSLEQAGTFYLAFTVDPPPGQDSLNYTLSLGVSDDVPNNINSEARLVLGELYDGEIDGDGDRDWIGVTLEAGVTYRISEMSHGEVFNSIAVYDLNGVSRASYGRLDVGDFEAAVYDFTPGSDGLFFIAVENSGINLQSVDATYQLLVEEIEDDHGDNEVSASALNVTGRTRGVLEHDTDRDVFSIDLDAHDVLIVETNLQSELSLAAVQGIHVDPFYGMMGAAETGEHYVAIGNGTGFGSDRSYVIDAQIIADEAGSGITTNATIDVNMTVSGLIATEFDEDWYAFDAASGQTTTVEILGSASLVFTLYDSAGVFQGEILGNGTLQIEFFETGTFFMAVRGTPPPGTVESYVINTGNAVGMSDVGTIDGDRIEMGDLGGSAFGLFGDDVIVSGAGNDVVTLGAGRDRFEMAEGGGTDWITDFDPARDRLALEIDPFTTQAEFAAMMTDTADGVRITLADGSSVLLQGVHSSELGREAIAFTAVTDNGPGPFWGFGDYDYGPKDASGASAEPISEKGDLSDPVFEPATKVAPEAELGAVASDETASAFWIQDFEDADPGLL